MYLLTMWLVEVGVAINIWTHHFTRYLFFFFFLRKTLPGTWWLKPCRWHRDSEITFAPITFILMYVCFGQPEIHMIIYYKKKKKIHMMRTSLYIYVIKCMALKRVINLFDCFKFFFLSLFLPFIFILNLFNFLKYWKIWQNLLVIRTQLIIINKWDFFCIPLDVMGNHVSIHRSNYSHTHLAHNKFFSSNSLF